jgi:hypothetical protein
MSTSLSDLTKRVETSRAARSLTHAILAKGANPGEFASELQLRLGTRSPHLEPLTNAAFGGRLVSKAAVGSLGTADAGLDSLHPLKSAWADIERRQTVIGRMGNAPRNVPGMTPITVVDSGVVAEFTAEGAPIKVAKPTLTDASQTPTKIALIVPYSAELARATNDNAATLIERDFSRAVAVGEDTALLDGQAGVVGERPASILYGLSALGSGSPADLDEDVRLLLATVRGGEVVWPHFITSPAGARYLMAARETTGGNRVFPNVTINGGNIHGAPLLISTGCPDATLALVDADALLVTDAGIGIDAVRNASFQFDSAPSAGAAEVVSLFQTNAIGVKIERWITWRLAWTDGAAFITLPLGSPA